LRGSEITGLGCGTLFLGLLALVLLLSVCITPFERPVDALVVEARIEPTTADYEVRYEFDGGEYAAQVRVWDTDPQWGAGEGDMITLWITSYDPEEPETERYLELFVDPWWWTIATLVGVPLFFVLFVGLPIDGIRWIIRRLRR
jgi:hypothetical protein